MDNSFLVGLSAQQVLQKRMDTTANNLANMTTAGFKAEQLVMRELSEKPARRRRQAAARSTSSTPGRCSATFPPARWSAPAIRSTSRSRARASSRCRPPAATAYTRDGRFTLNDAGPARSPAPAIPCWARRADHDQSRWRRRSRSPRTARSCRTATVVGTLNVVNFDDARRAGKDGRQSVEARPTRRRTPATDMPRRLRASSKARTSMRSPRLTADDRDQPHL